MNNKPLVSIIIPVFKVEKYIENCVKSVLIQTYKNLEIVIINDGTPDNSMKIVNDTVKNDERVIIINKKNGGVSSARNVGLEAAHGEFIFFVDSDDKINCKTIEILVSQMEDNVDIVAIGFKKVKSLDNSENIVEKKDFKCISGLDALKLYLNDNSAYWIVPWGKLYRTSLFESIRYPVGKIHEDEYITYKLFFKANKVVYSELELYHYLQRKDGIMGTISLSSQMNYIEALLQRNAFLKKQGIKEAYLKDTSKSMSTIVCTYEKILKTNNKKLLKEICYFYRKWVRMNFKVLTWKEKIGCIINCLFGFMSRFRK